MDYDIAFRQLQTELEDLAISVEHFEDAVPLHSILEIANIKRTGSKGEVLAWLRESFDANEQAVPVHAEWNTDLAFLDRGSSTPNFLVAFWRITKPEGGSLNLPYVIRKYAPDRFEIAMPA